MESLDDVAFADLAEMVDYLLPLMCGNVSAVLENERPGTAMDMMVRFLYPRAEDHPVYELNVSPSDGVWVLALHVCGRERDAQIVLGK